MLTSTPIKDAEALKLGLLDGVVSSAGQLLGAAKAHALDIAEGRRPRVLSLTRTGMRLSGKVRLGVQVHGGQGQAERRREVSRRTQHGISWFILRPPYAPPVVLACACSCHSSHKTHVSTPSPKHPHPQHPQTTLSRMARLLLCWSLLALRPQSVRDTCHTPSCVSMPSRLEWSMEAQQAWSRCVAKCDMYICVCCCVMCVCVMGL